MDFKAVPFQKQKCKRNKRSEILSILVSNVNNGYCEGESMFTTTTWRLDHNRLHRSKTMKITRRVESPNLHGLSSFTLQGNAQKSMAWTISQTK